MQSSTINIQSTTESPVLKETICHEAAWCLYDELALPDSEGTSDSNLLFGNDSLVNNSKYSLANFSTTASPPRPIPSVYGQASNILRTQVVVSICCLGLCGNILTLLFMTPRILRKHSSMGRITRYSYAGMITLAVSDLNFCLMGIIPLFIDDLRRTVCHLNFSVIYHVYSIALFNLFLLESTWLTVAMAAGRYLAICHPFRAKEWVGMRMFRRSILVLTLMCVLFNIPRFWTYEINTYTCNGTTIYRLNHGYLKRHSTFETTYQWMYFVLGIIIPLVILAYCNMFLIRALRSMQSTNPHLPGGSRGQESTRHITLTFVAIIIIYIVLVTPAEIIGFLRKLIMHKRNAAEREKYNLLVDIFNTFQAINFSLNFVVYCIINTSFRQSVMAGLKCLLHPHSYFKHKSKGGMLSHYSSVTTNSTVNGRHSFMMANTPRASLV